MLFSNKCQEIQPRPRTLFSLPAEANPVAAMNDPASTLQAATPREDGGLGGKERGSLKEHTPRGLCEGGTNVCIPNKQTNWRHSSAPGRRSRSPRPGRRPHNRSNPPGCPIGCSRTAVIGSEQRKTGRSKSSAQPLGPTQCGWARKVTPWKKCFKMTGLSRN